MSGSFDVGDLLSPTATWSCSSQIAPKGEECPCETCELKRRAEFAGPWGNWDDLRRELGF